ncbi:hypothetical protein HRbin29_00463 [bacterium HR29]|jgi:uncharacterized protein YggU (UPF0235/DUF167 family)|nr:hypothetical protein HRbin29_00463 [bacterium HR29]
MVRITLSVTPRASKPRVVWDGAVLRVWVTAPPVDGAANSAALALIAESLEVPRRAVRIAAGATSRRKVLEIDADPGDLARKLERLGP